MVKTVLVYIIYWILISIKEFIMQPELIFEPVINMLWLSLAVFAFGTVLRLKAIVIDKKNTEDDPGYAFELFYKFSVTDNITVTPALTYLTQPFANSTRLRGVEAFSGLVKTTFKF